MLKQLLIWKCLTKARLDTPSRQRGLFPASRSLSGAWRRLLAGVKSVPLDPRPGA